jgi:hypothetical protein
VRIYRSNPFDAVGRLPHAPRLLAFAVVVLLVLAAFGVWAELKTTSEGADHVRRALAAQGHTPTKVEPIRKGGCGRVRRLYRWEAGDVSGTACAGPRDRVEIRAPAA